jgi:uncharacterized Zn finger protein (UPF0148 family)
MHNYAKENSKGTAICPVCGKKAKVVAITQEDGAGKAPCYWFHKSERKDDWEIPIEYCEIDGHGKEFSRDQTNKPLRLHLVDSY